MKQTKWLSAIVSLVLVLSLFGGCATAEQPQQAPESQAQTETAAESSVEEGSQGGAAYQAGVYTGEGKGNNGSVTVEVTFSDSAITGIEVTAHTETAGLADPALERIPAQILDNQTLNVDAVSGATNTSNAIVEAVRDCVVQAGGDPDALMDAVQSQAGSGETLERQADILIIGAGAAGLTAANAAIQNGAENVILVEKMSSMGGASAVAGGLAGGTSKLQESLGLTGDSADLIYEDIMNGGHNLNDAPLVRLWADNMGVVFDWLVEDMEVLIQNQFSNFPEHRVQRSFYVEGGSVEMIRVLGEKFEASGGEILMETKATSFLMEDGAVVGAVAEDASGNTLNISAQATILATGGFGNNPDMLSDSLAVALFYGASSSTGEGILMAEEIGAKLQFMDYAKMYPQGIEVSPGFARVATTHSMDTTNRFGALYINKEGQRVINENLDFVSIKEETKKQTDNILFLVMDQAAWDNWSQLANDSLSSSGRFTFEEQEAWFDAQNGTPIFERGEDLEAVANAAVIDGAALKETIEHWNEMVAAGADQDFGREELHAFSTEGPFYIVEQKLRFATTLGGVSIDESFRVKDTQDQPIAGLYAAGECVGGVHGDESMPTCMLSWAVTSGKLAGDVVSEAIKG